VRHAKTLTNRLLDGLSRDVCPWIITNREGNNTAGMIVILHGYHVHRVGAQASMRSARWVWRPGLARSWRSGQCCDIAGGGWGGVAAKASGGRTSVAVAARWLEARHRRHRSESQQAATRWSEARHQKQWPATLFLKSSPSFDDPRSCASGTGFFPTPACHLKRS
jgi:hypothetical protein